MRRQRLGSMVPVVAVVVIVVGILVGVASALGAALLVIASLAIVGHLWFVTWGPTAEPNRQVIVELDGGDPWYPLPQQIGGEPWPWSDLQHVVAEVTGPLYPRQEVDLQHLRPIRAAQELKMELVHRCIR